MLKKKARLFDQMGDIFVSHDNQLWPFYAYEIIAPEVVTQDIFAKFFLSIMRVENKRFSENEFTYNGKSIMRVKRAIKQSLPNLFSDELLDKIITKIEEMNIVNKEKFTLEDFESNFTSEVSLSSNLKKITLLQDAVSGEVVPHIDFVSDFNLLNQSQLRYEIKSAKLKKPSLLQIQKAYNYAKLIEEKLIDDSFDEPEDEYMWFEDESELDEVFIDKFIQDEDVSIEIKSTKNIDRNNHILYLNENPQLVYLEFQPYTNKLTNELLFLSPFSDSSNSWFTNVVLKSKSTNKEVGKLIEDLSELTQQKYDEYKAEINKQIQEEVTPDIINELEQDTLLVKITNMNEDELVNTYKEIQKLIHINARTVNTEFGVFLEGLLTIISRPYNSKFNEIKEYVDKGQNRFKQTLEFMAKRKDVELPSCYYDKVRYEQINQLVKGKGNAKHFMLTRVSYLLIVESYFDDTIIGKILDKDKKFLTRLQLLNRARNANSHYNKKNDEIDLTTITNDFKYIIEEIIDMHLEGEVTNG